MNDTKPMLLAYVAGPYRAKTERRLVDNIRSAEMVAMNLWRMGFAVLCPHLNSAHMGGVVPDDVFLAGDLVMMERCDLVVLTYGWRKSSGAMGEIARAVERGLPVYCGVQYETELGGLILGPEVTREMLTAMPEYLSEVMVAKGATD